MKLNNITPTEKMRKPVLEEVTYMINVYLMENGITTTKFYIMWTLLSRNIAIQTTSIKKAKKLKEEDGSIKVLESKAKLMQK